MAKRVKKLHAVKKANKHLNKLQKRGELKKKKNKKVRENKKINQVVNGNQNIEPSDGEESDPRDMFEKEDLDNLITQHLGTKESGKKRLHNHEQEENSGDDDDDDDEENEFDSRPRKWFGKDEDNKITKVMLPIKEKTGIVPQYMEIEKEEESIKEEQPNPVIEDKPATRQCTTVELYANRTTKLTNRKAKIAHYATKVLENPQENIKCLKELRFMMDEKDRDIFVTIRKLTAASLLEILKDILPEYHIRTKSEKEQKQKLKKETKILMNYEETLLKNYKIYLQRLEAMLKGLKLKRKQFERVDVKQNSIYTLGALSVKCLSELLVARPSFNYRNNIIHLLIPFLNHPDDAISDLVCSSVQRIFKEDKLGAVSLECVKAIGRLVKEKNFIVLPKVLYTLLSLKVKNIVNTEEKKKPLTKDERYKISRTERKRRKQMAALEKSLRETKGQESKEEKLKYQTDILSQVFVMYFKILKKGTKSVLIPPVLEGLAKFAHLINVEFFDDLISVLHNLITSGELNYRENMHCVQTVFTILSGQGSSFNIDPLRFYTHLYTHLLNLHSGISSNDIPVLLTCLDLMFTRRKKQVSLPRLLAFVKRLCIISLQVNHDAAIGLLMFVRSMIQCHKQCDVLLDADASLGSGVYLAELEEPEHCNANTTALWELHLLRRNYHPLVQTLATHLLRGAPVVGDGQLSMELHKKSPIDLWTMFDISKGNFLPPMPEPDKSKSISKKTKSLKNNSLFINSELSKKAKTILEIETSDDEYTDSS